MRYVPAVAFLAIAILTSAIGQASDKPKLKEPNEIKIYCPVVGLPGLKTECRCPSGYCSLKPKDTLTAEYQGGKIRFCCGNCVKMFKEAPAKFAVTANHQLVATKQAKQIACPNCGSTVSYVTPLDVGGITVGFCPECNDKAKAASPDERVKMVFSEKAFARGFETPSAKKK